MRYVAFLGAIVLAFAGSARAQLNPGNPFLFAPSTPALASAPAMSAAAAVPQGVHGVFPSYNFQIYAGYTYLRFYEVPNLTSDMNGFNFGMVDYFHDWVGVEGEFMAAFASQSGVNAKLAAGMGGVRIRVPNRSGIELWAHGLVGGAHLIPQTPFGGQSGLAYEVGGGVDLNPHHGRIVYRVAGDAVGTQLFGTYQVSPRASIGLVYRF